MQLLFPSLVNVLSGSLHLADSPWPMTGHDPRRSGRSPLRGPRRGCVVRRQGLPAVTRKVSGLTVQQDGTLCLMTSREVMFVRPGGRTWCRRFEASKKMPSPATALADGRWASTLGYALLLWTVRDEELAVETVRVGERPLDDSCVSPGFSSGCVVLGAITGEVLAFDGHYLAQVGSRSFGYDVLPPSALPDGALVVSGYAGRGLCCVELDGTPRWSLAKTDPDLLTSVHSAGVVAAGSLNEGCSWLVSSGGERLGSFPAPALWAEHGSERWVAWSREALVGASLDGTERWRRPWPEKNEGSWSRRQPIVDGEGWAYALHAGGLLAVDDRGEEQLSLVLRDACAMALVADGSLVVATRDELLWIE